MEYYKIQIVTLVSFMFLFQNIQGWSIDGHAIVCKIAQDRLTDTAASAVKNLLPDYANNDLSSVCSWADKVRFYLHWSAPLHFADTPKNQCNFNYKRDCKDLDGEKDRCVVGAINNYTTQLLDYGKDSSYNLTHALLFLSHFMGDVHQPLHTGFDVDKGANLINVKWYTRQQNLHHVWDANIIETAEEQYYDSTLDGYVSAIQENITRTWSDDVKDWEACSSDEITCPEVYAAEGSKAACQWAYKDAPEGAVLEDDYFESRLPIVSLRLAQGGVRLAAALNRIFT